VMGVVGKNKGKAIIDKYLAAGEESPEEIHFYDDLKKNTDEVEAAVAGQVPAELHVYGPGEFAHDEADPERPNKSFDASEDLDPRGISERKRISSDPILGYPKTLDVGESMLRSLVRNQLIREWDIMHALMSSPENAIQGLYQFFRDDVFGPTQQERLKRTGDDKIIDRYQTFIGTLHLTPEYKLVWENYKQAQRRHSSMDSDFDRARDIQHPVGRAFNKLKSKLMMKLEEMERTLSPENRDLWKPSIDQERESFEKIFSNWYAGKMTTGRVLGLLDPRGIVESRRRGRGISEAGEMFAGRDLEQLQTSEFLAALETAEMDLEDAGCPEDSEARVITFEAMEMIDRGRERPGYNTSALVPIANDVISAIRECEHIDTQTAESIAKDLEAALDRTQEVDRY
jgi:hypothetical protein